MKKLLLLFISLISAFSSYTYWYEINANDTNLAVSITNKIENLISKKWEWYRNMYINKINSYKNQNKDNERIQKLTDIVNKNITDNSRILIQKKILTELDKEWFPDLNFIYSTWAIENMPFLLNRLLDEKLDKFHKLLQTEDSKINFALIKDFDDDDSLSYLFWLITNYNDINWNDQTRNIIDIFQDKLSAAKNEMFFSKRLYEIYKIANKDDKLNSDQKRILEKTIKSFELNWIALSDDKIEKLKQINQELTKLSFDFWNNLVDSQKEFTYYIDKIDTIKELPEDILAQAHEEAKKQDKNGYLFNYNTADYLISYCSDANIRKTIRNSYKTFSSSWKYDNRPNILKILKLRQDKAIMLWYKNYWEYSLSDKMAPSPEFVMQQEDKILTKAKEKANKEVAEIKEYFKLDTLNVWDHWYYSRKLQEEKYKLDANTLRDYFEYNNVMKGLFNTANKLYWLEFKESNMKMYSDDVKMYEVYKDWKLKWYYLYDPYYNSNKSSWAWANILRNKKTNWDKEVLPIVIDVLNISKWKDKTLLEHYDLIAIFHEFGHAIHALLWESKYGELSGFNVEWDFVELPSQLMENWTYWEWLKTFALNYKTWEKISDELLEKIEKSKTFSTWVWTITQIVFSRVDMKLHSTTAPETIEALDKLNSWIIEEIWFFKNDTENKFYSSFSHIFNWWYEAWYYSYLRAEIIESDVFSEFRKNWIFDKKTADKFYNTILSQWSRKSAIELFKDFMWRDIELDWFYKKKWF